MTFRNVNYNTLRLRLRLITRTNAGVQYFLVSMTVNVKVMLRMGTT